MSAMSLGPVVIIDIGSNSIKSLVATRGPSGAILKLAMRTIDARISAGISRTEPRLSDDGMARGVDAVRSLLADANAFQPTQTILVATSAVRDARNGDEFRARMRAAVGQEIRVLSGEEEANLIGRGLAADPALGELRNFYVFDLGGGSLECLAFRERRIEQAISLQLGCVRLTERFVGDVSQPVSAATLEQIAGHTCEMLRASNFRLALPPEAVAVGTGGTVSTVRAIIGARANRPFEATSPGVLIEQLRELLDSLSSMSLVDRQRVPGLPPARADVFPTALATLIAVAEVGGFSTFRNSVYNLRYGLAAEALDAADAGT